MVEEAESDFFDDTTIEQGRNRMTTVPIGDDIATSDGVTINRVRGLRGVPMATGDTLDVGQVWKKRGVMLRAAKAVPGYFDVDDYGAIADYGVRLGTVAQGSTTLVLNPSSAGLSVGQIVGIKGVTGTRMITAIVDSLTVSINTAADAATTLGVVSTDNLAAFNAAMSAMSAADSSKGGTLVFHGQYFLSDTLHISRSCVLKGTNASISTHEPASALVFPGGCDGIRVHASLTDVPPTGKGNGTGSGGYSTIRDFSLYCRDYNDFDIGAQRGTQILSEVASLYLRKFATLPWNGVATAGTSGSHNFVTSGHDPTQGAAFREYSYNGGAGLQGDAAVTHAKTIQFDGTRYLVGDASTKLGDIITASAYALQFVVQFTSAAAAGSPTAESALFTDNAGTIFVTYSSSGLRAGHKDAGGVKMTSYVPLALNTAACIQVQYDGTNIVLKVEGGASASVAAGSVSGTLSALTPRLGANAAGAGIVGRVAQVLAYNSAPGWVKLEANRIGARIAYGYTNNRGHGIRVSARCTIDNVRVEGFGENGLAVFAAEAPAEIYGNADHMVVRNCTFSGCGGHGMHFWGSDSQAGSTTDCEATVNQGFGIYEESLSGNKHDTCHAEANRGHQEDFIANRDYTNPNRNFTRFHDCYTEGGFNLFLGSADVTGLAAETVTTDPRSDGFVFAAGIATAAPFKYESTRGARKYRVQMGSDGASAELTAFVLQTFDDGGASSIDTTRLDYNDTLKWWELQNGSIYRNVVRYPTIQSNVRQPAPWFENGIMLERRSVRFLDHFDRLHEGIDGRLWA